MKRLTDYSHTCFKLKSKINLLCHVDVNNLNSNILGYCCSRNAAHLDCTYRCWVDLFESRL